MLLSVFGDGIAPGTIRASPVERMFGPGASPELIRSRIRRVLSWGCEVEDVSESESGEHLFELAGKLGT